MYCLTFILKVNNTVQDTDPYNNLMKTSIGAQTLNYFIMILLKGPDNPQVSFNSMIHINSNNIDTTAPLSVGSWAHVSKLYQPWCGGGSNLQGISGSPESRIKTETVSSLSSVSILQMVANNVNVYRECSPDYRYKIGANNLQLFHTKRNKLFYLIQFNPNSNKDSVCVEI